MNIYTNKIERLYVAVVKTPTGYEKRMWARGRGQYHYPPIHPLSLSWVRRLASPETRYRYRPVATLDISSAERQMVHSLHVARLVDRH